MAEFNPQVPNTQDPNYFNYSKPIEHVLADKSAGIALSTLGEGIESLAGIAKKTANDIIEKDVRSTVEPIRSQFASQLEQARNGIPQPAQTATGGKVALGFADEGQPQQLPAAITKGTDQIESIQESFVNGKINDTYYHQRLSTAVTQLRSRYPGFVDEIDAKVSQITGVNPANAYVNDLMQDINRAATNKKTEQDKILNLALGAMTKGFDKANLMYERLQSDPTFSKDFLAWYTEENAKWSRLQYEDLKRNNLQGSKDYQNKEQREMLSSFLRDAVDSDLHATLKLSGMNEAKDSLAILQDARDNPGKYSPQQMEEFATRMQAQDSIMKTQLTALARSKGYKVTDADLDAAVDSASRIYPIMYKALREGGAGGAGLAFALANQTRAIADERTSKLTKGELGEWYHNVEYFQQKLGSNVAGLLMPDIIRNSDGLKATGALLSKQVTGAIAQTDPKNPTTVAQHAAEVNSLLKQKRITLEDKGYHMEKLVNVVDYLRNPEIPLDVKSDIVQYMFHPENNSFLQNFKADYTTRDPSGRLKVEHHPGKQTVLVQMMNKDITKEVSKLDTKSQQLYANWVDTTTREIIGEDVRNLSHVTGHDNIGFVWKDKQLQIDPNSKGLESPVGKTPNPRPGPPLLAPLGDIGGTNRGFDVPLNSVNPGYVWQIQNSLDHINKILPHLDHFYKTLGGGDTESMLLNTLQRNGMDNLGSISGLPKAIGDAIAASRKKPIKGGE